MYIPLVETMVFEVVILHHFQDNGVIIMDIYPLERGMLQNVVFFMLYFLIKLKEFLQIFYKTIEIYFANFKQKLQLQITDDSYIHTQILAGGFFFVLLVLTVKFRLENLSKNRNIIR